jgi:hypothetical protein
MPDTDHGFAFEESFAKEMGAELQPGSGNQWWARQDIDGCKKLWQLKSTKNKVNPVNLDVIKDTIDAVEAPGGVGGDYEPGWALEIGGEVFVMERLSDWKRRFTEKEKLSLGVEGKSEAKRRMARTSQLLRDIDDA